MPLFPALGPEWLDEKDSPILSRMAQFYAEAITINQSFWGEADIDSRFVAGDQTLWTEMYGNLPANRRMQFNFNRIRRVVNMISGHQRRNRMSTVVTAQENGDNQTADQFTKLMMWTNQQNGVLETISESFEGSLITGMNLLHVWLDYRNDPVNGDIRVDNCAYNSFLIDPFFRKPDLSDCNSLWKRTYVTKRAACSLLPDKQEEIIKLHASVSRDGRFQFMPENYNYDAKNLLSYDEFYYRDFRDQLMLVDTQTGESMEWKSEDKVALQQFLNLYPQITTIRQQVPTVRLAIVLQGKVMYDGPNPLGIDSYPFVPVISYYRPEIPYFPWRVQGVVRGLRDPQYLYNRRKVIELDILESQINSGWIYKEDALVNPKDVFLAGQGRGLALKETANMTDVQQIIAPAVPASTIQLSEILAREIQEISGVSEELLGSAVDDKAGVLAMLRQGAALTTLQGLFDQLDYSQKLLGKIMLDVIQCNFTPGKVKRIIKEEPAPQFYNKAFGKYDCAVEEGFNTTTQRQMQFIQLIKLKEIGVQIPDAMLIKCATLQYKNELLQYSEQVLQSQQQMQQMQMQSQMEAQQATTQMLKSEAAAAASQGMERMSKIEDNQALAMERRAAAERDHEAGLLNLVKAIKELEGMDLDQLEKLQRLATMVNSGAELSAPPQAQAAM